MIDSKMVMVTTRETNLWGFIVYKEVILDSLCSLEVQIFQQHKKLFNYVNVVLSHLTQGHQLKKILYYLAKYRNFEVNTEYWTQEQKEKFIILGIFSNTSHKNQ